MKKNYFYISQLRSTLNDVTAMLKVAKENGQYIASLFQVNKINTLVSELISPQITNLVSEPGREVIFSLKGIEFIDNAGFDVLANAAEIAKARNSVFKICNVGKEVLNLIEASSLKDTLPMCDCASYNDKKLAG